mgnify:CR=1 FL=1
MNKTKLTNVEFFATLLSLQPGMRFTDLLRHLHMWRGWNPDPINVISVITDHQFTWLSKKQKQRVEFGSDGHMFLTTRVRNRTCNGYFCSGLGLEYSVTHWKNLNGLWYNIKKGRSKVNKRFRTVSALMTMSEHKYGDRKTFENNDYVWLNESNKFVQIKEQQIDRGVNNETN